MIAYIDAGTAAAIAAMATGGLAGVKVAAQSFFTSARRKKPGSNEETTNETTTAPAAS